MDSEIVGRGMVLGLVGRGMVLGLAVAAPVGPIGVLVIRRSLAHGASLGHRSARGRRPSGASSDRGRWARSASGPG
jgi:hypothetical protein